MPRRCQPVKLPFHYQQAYHMPFLVVICETVLSRDSDTVQNSRVQVEYDEFHGHEVEIAPTQADVARKILETSTTVALIEYFVSGHVCFRPAFIRFIIFIPLVIYVPII